MIELYHCPSARSFRCLWALEHLRLPYELKLMAFPPRASMPEYLRINPLGTVPALRDGGTLIIESAAALQYLAAKYGPALALTPEEPDYGAFLNWTHYGETSLTVPLALIVRYKLGPEKLPQAVTDYTENFAARLALVETALDGREYLAGERFTIADISVHYALDLAEFLGLGGQFGPNVAAYAARLREMESYAATRRAQKVPRPA